MSDIAMWIGGGLIAAIILATLWGMFKEGPPPGGLSSRDDSDTDR
jgi:hypothetical protein